MRPRLSYANVVSTIALFLVLTGGAAYAANTVFSTDIVDGEVKTADLASPAVTNNKLAANSVTTGKVAADNLAAVDLAPGSVGSSEVTDHALTGADIVESTLVGVDADTVDGGNLCRTEGTLRVRSNEPPVTVCTSGSLSLIARCTGGSSDVATVATLALDTSANFSFVSSGVTDAAEFHIANHPVPLVTVSDNDTAGSSIWKGDTSFAAGNPDGSQLSGSATAWANHPPILSGNCRFVVGATD
jgi:hypothetical protein